MYEVVGFSLVILIQQSNDGLVGIRIGSGLVLLRNARNLKNSGQSLYSLCIATPFIVLAISFSASRGLGKPHGIFHHSSFTLGCEYE